MLPSNQILYSNWWAITDKKRWKVYTIPVKKYYLGGQLEGGSRNTQFNLLYDSDWLTWTPPQLNGRLDPPIHLLSRHSIQNTGKCVIRINRICHRFVCVTINSKRGERRYVTPRTIINPPTHNHGNKYTTVGVLKFAAAWKWVLWLRADSNEITAHFLNGWSTSDHGA